MAEVLFPPGRFLSDNRHLTVFLAGSIDNGAAEDWQSELFEKLSDVRNVTLFNPRRKDWDPSWGEDHPELIAQIVWELDHLEQADITVFYFAPDSKAPITFLELGRFGDQDGVVVCCPPGFYRRTNVKVYCDRYQIKMVDSLNDMVKYICDTAKMVEFP